ncbi:hypothetical protein [Sulfuricurvum sp.]|uniref:hypothetical protein n=1 Tax=Sulfuricurvum sp. TaxID=2025608 RepID=UPI0035644AC2
MSAIIIDNKEYALEDLTEDAQAQIASIQVVDQKIADLNAQLAIMQTARNAYAQTLVSLLPKKRAKK